MNRSVVVVRLMGGLGNQLFQCAHAYNLAQRGSRVYVDTSWYHSKHRGETPRKRELRQADIALPLVRLPRAMWDSRLPIAQTETDKPASAKLDRPRFLMRLDLGYWQSRGSAVSARPQIEALLRRRLGGLWSDASVRRDYVAVHVRLGDYLEPSTGAFHGVTNYEAQLELAGRMRDATGSCEVRVFSDSPERIAELVSSRDGFALDASLDSFAALLGMASGRGLIMSNSSLSWWAATLAQWKDPRGFETAMPKPWLRQPSHFDVDLLDPRWTTYEREQD